MAPITGFNERKIRNETSPPPSRGTPADGLDVRRRPG